MTKSRRDYAPAAGGVRPLAFLVFSLFMGSRLPPCTGSGRPAAELAAAGGACAGGACLWGAGAEMESDASRRVLQEVQMRYLSYLFLKADAVPCSRAGLPYYNCHALPRSNPYSRGCLTITRCARDSGP